MTRLRDVPIDGRTVFKIPFEPGLYVRVGEATISRASGANHGPMDPGERVTLLRQP